MADSQAWAEGWQIGTEGAQRRIQHKQALADEEHEAHINDLFAQRDAITKNPTLPDTEKALKLQDVAAQLREAYHPDKHPGALQKFGHLITDNMRITDPMKRAKKEGDQKAARSAGDEKTAQGWMSEAPVSPEKQAEIDAQAAATKQRIGNEANEKYFSDYFDKYSTDKSPEAKQRFMEQAMGIASVGSTGTPQTFLAADGKTSFIGTRGKDGRWQYLSGELIPDELLNGATLAPRPTAVHPSTSQFNEALAAYARAHGTTADKLPPEAIDYVTKKLAEDKQFGSSNTSTTLKLDANGFFVPVTETNTRNPQHPQLTDPLGPISTDGTAGAPSPATNKVVPKARPTIQASQLARPQAGHTQVGPPLFQSRTPEISKAEDALRQSDRMALLADGLLKQAQVNPNGMSEADTNFVLSLIRSEAGRVNQQEIAQLFNAGGIAELPDRWASRAGHGQLPPDLRQQLADFTHGIRDADAQELARLKQPSGNQPPSTQGSTDFDPSKDFTPVTGPK